MRARVAHGGSTRSWRRASCSAEPAVTWPACCARRRARWRSSPAWRASCRARERPGALHRHGHVALPLGGALLAELAQPRMGARPVEILRSPAWLVSIALLLQLTGGGSDPEAREGALVGAAVVLAGLAAALAAGGAGLLAASMRCRSDRARAGRTSRGASAGAVGADRAAGGRLLRELVRAG